MALVDQHIQLLRYLESEGGADLLPTTIDAYTRQNRYEEAAKGIEKSRAAGHSLLNGFPAVNHGIEGCRRVTEAVRRPIQVRHGTPDARLLAEITLASGFTSYEGGGISYNIPYAKKVPLDKSIRDWQYVDRLVGYYEENGVSINREPFGPLTGTLVPPFISHTIAILEGLLALEQGVKSITLGYGQGGNIIQDLAAVASLRELAQAYFKEAGYTDYDLTMVFHQWMGGFPEDEAKAFAVINLGSVVAAMARGREDHRQDAARGHGHPDAGGQRRGTQVDPPDPEHGRGAVGLRRQQGRARRGGADRPRGGLPDEGRDRGGRGRPGPRRGPGLRRGPARRAVRPVLLQPGQGPAHPRQRRLHPRLRQGLPAAGRGHHGRPQGPARRAGQGRGPRHLLPNGHGRHLRHQQGQAHREAE